VDATEIPIYENHEVSIVNSKGKMYAVMYGKVWYNVWQSFVHWQGMDVLQVMT